MAINELKEKARRAFYAIKKSTQVDIPIRTWLKIFQSVIEPIALYGSEVWGPLTKHDFGKWEKHPIEILHAEFCKRILRVQRKTPNNACRAELGQYPLIINIEKRAIKFWKHLKMSDPKSYHYKALKSQEMNIEKSPLSQLVLMLNKPTSEPPRDTPNNNPPQDSDIIPQQIRPNQIMNQQKQKYENYWIETTKTQSKLNCYLALKRQYTVAEYLSMVTDNKVRKTLTMYRLSEHSLAMEKGRHGQTWLPIEDRLCSHCGQGVVETELHFLTACDKYKQIREEYYPKFTQITKIKIQFDSIQAIPYLLGEKAECSRLAAKYVAACHKMRDNG